MALTLEQYATYLDSRDLPWPAAPSVERPRARPSLTPLPKVKVVLWNIYGTLLSLLGGDLLFEHPQPFVMDIALDKIVQEFKMWGSMTRKPGQPAEYLGQIYRNGLVEQRALTSDDERYPEIISERLWEGIIKKLLQKDYKFDANFYGSLNEFSRKMAYFFHASLQGTAAYPGAATALRLVRDAGLEQGLFGEGQCFTLLQLQRALSAQEADAHLDDLMTEGLVVLSAEHRARKPSERLYDEVLDRLAARDIAVGEVLVVGPRVTQDLIPAKRLGMRTALFAGDKASLQATPEQLKDPTSRPDVLLTELPQIIEVIG
jgi:FMN phosphatase YigB (HAD superfamily)